MDEGGYDERFDRGGTQADKITGAGLRPLYERARALPAMSCRQRERYGKRTAAGRRVLKIVGLFFYLLSRGVTTAGAAELPILDTLGGAAPTTHFSLFGSWGTAIYRRSYVGVQFTLPQPTVLTEIGGFVNNCHTISGGIPQCPYTQPFTVEIRPATSNGGLDPSRVLASSLLSHDHDPLVISYESVALHLPLEPGTYFAVFVPQGEDGGILLRSASDPVNYLAETVTLGILDLVIGAVTLSQTPGAVRIVGVPLLQVSLDIEPGKAANRINLRSTKSIPVAIVTTATFDATTVDPDTILFGASGVEAPPGTSSGMTLMVIGGPISSRGFESLTRAFNAEIPKRS